MCSSSRGPRHQGKKPTPTATHLGGHQHASLCTNVGQPLIPQVRHISPSLSIIIISRPITEPYLWPLSISTCSCPTGPPANLLWLRYHSCHATFAIPASSPQGVPLYFHNTPNLALCTLTSSRAEMSPPHPCNPRSWNVTLSKWLYGRERLNGM